MPLSFNFLNIFEVIFSRKDSKLKLRQELQTEVERVRLDYLAKHPREGALGRVYAAIERGDKIGLESELKEAFEAHMGGNRLETTLSDVRNQPDETKMGVYGDLAKLLGDVDGYKGSAVSVSENLPGAIQGLQQRLAIAESVSKPKGGDNASH